MISIVSQNNNVYPRLYNKFCGCCCTFFQITSDCESLLFLILFLSLETTSLQAYILPHPTPTVVVHNTVSNQAKQILTQYFHSKNE